MKKAMCFLLMINIALAQGNANNTKALDLNLVLKALVKKVLIIDEKLSNLEKKLEEKEDNKKNKEMNFVSEDEENLKKDIENIKIELNKTKSLVNKLENYIISIPQKLERIKYKKYVLVDKDKNFGVINKQGLIKYASKKVSSGANLVALKIYPKSTLTSIDDIFINIPYEKIKYCEDNLAFLREKTLSYELSCYMKDEKINEAKIEKNYGKVLVKY